MDKIYSFGILTLDLLFDTLRTGEQALLTVRHKIVVTITHNEYNISSGEKRAVVDNREEQRLPTH